MADHHNDKLCLTFVDSIPLKYKNLGQSYVKLYDVRKDRGALLDYEIRGLVAEPTQWNPHVPDAVQRVEREVSECYGRPWTDPQNWTGFQTYLFTTSDTELFDGINFWNIFAFLLDDHCDQVSDPAILRQWYIKYKTGKSDDNTPLDKLLLKSTKIIDKFLSPDQNRRYTDYVLQWINSFETLCDYKNGGDMSLVSYEEYWANRIIDVGGLFQLVWCEVSAGFDPAVYQMADHQLYRAFGAACIKHCTLVNDLYSFGKEVRAGDVRHNYMYLIMCREGLSAQQAVDRIVTEIHDLWSLVVDYSQRLAALDIPGLVNYISETIHMTKGNHYWHTICGRYNKHDV